MADNTARHRCVFELGDSYKVIEAGDSPSEENRRYRSEERFHRRMMAQIFRTREISGQLGRMLSLTSPNGLEIVDLSFEAKPQ